MFYRQQTDGTRVSVDLRNHYAGPEATPCWIIGGGPSLAGLPVEWITRSPAPKLALNLAGSRLLRPTFWTSYDPTERFHPSLYLDPSVTKFVHACRAMDLIPGTTFKVCEAPALYFFDRDKQRGYHDFPDPGLSSVTDWQDTLIQAIDIAYALGFRTLYLAGCEMTVLPGNPLLEHAAKRGIVRHRGELLGDYLKRCEQGGILREEIEQLACPRQYHFDEHKPLRSAVQTDFHYFRVVQYLRLARRTLSLAGLSLVSVTPDSRLNDFFPFATAEEACGRIVHAHGDPAREETTGRYTMSRSPEDQDGPLMRDLRPHFWPPRRGIPPLKPQGGTASNHPKQDKAVQILRELREIPVDLHER